MLESIYLSLIGISFICLLLSVCIGNKDSTKLISKIILSGVAMALFSVLAISSVDIEIVYCSSVACTTESIFYGEYGYIFWTMGIISALVMFSYSIVLLLHIFKPKVLLDRQNVDFM